MLGDIAQLTNSVTSSLAVAREAFGGGVGGDTRTQISELTGKYSGLQGDAQQYYDLESVGMGGVMSRLSGSSQFELGQGADEAERRRAAAQDTFRRTGRGTEEELQWREVRDRLRDRASQMDAIGGEMLRLHRVLEKTRGTSESLTHEAFDTERRINAALEALGERGTSGAGTGMSTKFPRGLGFGTSTSGQRGAMQAGEAAFARGTTQRLGSLAKALYGVGMDQEDIRGLFEAKDPGGYGPMDESIENQREAIRRLAGTKDLTTLVDIIREERRKQLGLVQ
jgi:hypothetical protein